MKLIQSNIKTMSSTQLGELLGYEKKEVNRKILAMFQSEIDGGIISPSFDSRGYIEEYHLPEVEAQMFAAKWNIKHLRKVVEFFVSAPKPAVTLPGNYIEALQALIESEKDKAAAQEQLQIAAPKLEYHDKVLSAANGLRTTEVAAEFGMSAMKLNLLLQDMKVQRKIGKRWVLTAAMLGQDLTVESTYIDDCDKARHSMLWTEKGRKLIHELIGSE